MAQKKVLNKDQIDNKILIWGTKMDISFNKNYNN